MSTKLRKGDRVEFNDKSGKTKYGVVEKGGAKKVVVILDGGKLQIKGSPKVFRHSAKPLPKDPPSVMDKWSVKKYKQIEGHGDTPTFSADICLNNKAVLFASNNGWGGPNEYRPKPEYSYDILQSFLSDVKEWAKKFGRETAYGGMEDIWIEWYVLERPYGVTAKEALNF